MFLFQLDAMIRHRLDPDSGEECVLVAEANSGTQQTRGPLDRDN